MAIFTARIERAIALTLRAHEMRARRADGGTSDAAVHPVTVALILSRFTADEDTIIAGLLHGTLEDTELPPETIAGEFGDKVLQMVQDVSESRLPGLSWDTRKARFLRRLQAAPRPSLLITSADKIANLIAMVSAHAAGGDAASPRSDTPPARTLDFYRQVYGVVRAAWATCPLLQEFRNRLEEAERKLLVRSG